MPYMDLNERTDSAATHAKGTIYHRREWSHVLHDVHHHNVYFLEKGEGIFPLALIKSRLFGNRLISLPFADYGGPLADCKHDAECLIRNACVLADELDVDFIEVRSPGTDYHETLEHFGFSRRDDYFTVILDIDGNEEKMWGLIGKKNRNMVRKSQNNNVEIKIAEDFHDLKTFYDAYLKTMKKLGSPPQPFAYFSALWEYFFPDSLLLCLAYSKSSCVSGSLYFLYNRTIHHAYSCTLTESTRLGQNEAIQWAIIQWGLKNGFNRIDLGRTRQNAGNEFFKKKWGGSVESMPYYYLSLKKELKERDEIRYRHLAKLWSQYMPECLANKIGPQIIQQIG